MNVHHFELNLSNFITEKVENMYSMLYGCKSLEKLNISNFNINKVETMYKMFYECKSLKELNFPEYYNNYSKANRDYIMDGCDKLKENDEWK